MTWGQAVTFNTSARFLRIQEIAGLGLERGGLFKELWACQIRRKPTGNEIAGEFVRAAIILVARLWRMAFDFFNPDMRDFEIEWVTGCFAIRNLVF